MYYIVDQSGITLSGPYECLDIALDNAEGNIVIDDWDGKPVQEGERND